VNDVHGPAGAGPHVDDVHGPAGAGPHVNDVHRPRRARLLATLGAEAALIVPAAPELHVGTDGELRYLPDADLYYLTGYTEPEAVLVLCPSAESPYTLFVRPRDAERERWTGARGGVEAARDRFGANAAFPLAELAERLPALVAGADLLYVPLQSGRAEVDAAVRAVVAAARRTRPRTGRGPHTVVDPRLLLGPMRVIKESHEVELVRQAADITVDAFIDAARMIRGAAGEWQVEATLEQAFRRAGASGPAFPSIIAAGANATVLHYVQNDGPIHPGDTLLVDGGARYRMYCGDISRCFPASGRFTAGQRAVYDIVLRAHDAAIAEVAMGRTAEDLHLAAQRALVEGMVELGLLRGDVDGIIERGDHKVYYPHRTSHWLGLDVHDVGDYALPGGAAVRLRPGMVLTVEPGLYIPADDEDAPAALRGIGIRLEDDLLVTGDGHENLTGRLPILPDDVEALMDT
jgi:Xaa-Pro aminopeptidase